MTGMRRKRTPHSVSTGRTGTGTPGKPRLSRRARATAASVVAIGATAALAASCGVVPGVSGGTKAPITVMTWAPEKTKATNMPGMPALARAYARWVNDNGGIAGRELNVITCNDHNDTVGADQCARQAVDAGAVAVVGSYSQFGRSFLSPLEAAGIAYIGGYGVTDAEFTSSVSYPVNGGQPALMAGMGQQLADRCARVAVVRPDTIAGDDLPLLLNSGLSTGKRAPAIDVLAAEDATEYTKQAEQALTRATSDPAKEGCVAAALGDRTDTFFDSFRRTRDDYAAVRVGTVFGSVDQSVVDRTGGKSSPYEGAYVSGWYPVAADARWNAMRKVISEEAFGDNRIDATDAGVQTTWIAYTVFKKVIESIGEGEVSARSVRRVLDDGLKVDTGGVTPTLSWRFQDMLAAKDYPRIVNAEVTFQVVRGGRMVAQRPGFVNVSKTLEKAPTAR
ncbi:ABC transporter substrate-binding protein [Streptomyces sp. NPDC058001]|uniref:ABC transporter substrate-binding protein n=1 Tax=Streptomyces sp. NPDC058001 TaxID=3346300 RepID=UPI0036ECB461